MCQCRGYDANTLAIDIATPCNARLRGFYKRSFAYYTIKERLPRLLSNTINFLYNQRKDVRDKFGREGKEELKAAIENIWNLKHELQINTFMSNIVSNATHMHYFNDYLDMHRGTTYFTAPWLYTESYMYKRIHEIFASSVHLKSLDYFNVQKRESYVSSIDAMEQLGSYFVSTLSSDDCRIKEAFIDLLKLNLWGNKADLSFGNGQVETASDPLELLKSIEPFLLCDDSKNIWEVVSDLYSPSDTIDIVLDNVGYELFADLCVADFILAKNLAINIRLYVKIYPYYISDATLNDLKWMLEQMGQSSNYCIQKLAMHWSQYIRTKRIVIVEDDYWISPLNYCSMFEIKPELYKELSKAKLIIFKGDLHYRKLVGERNWDPMIPLAIGVETFQPTALCSLRIIKCDTVCGVSQSVVHNIEKHDPNWMINGKYGTIQFSNRRSYM